MLKKHMRFKIWAVLFIFIASNILSLEALKVNVAAAPLVKIYNVYDLDSVRDNPDGNYILMADIDMSGIEWEPISGDWRSYLPFSGIFDGNGYTIRNLTTGSAYGYNGVHGLFGFVNSGTLKNIIIENADINGYSAGALIGDIDTGIVENCVVKNSNISGDLAGGLIGKAGNMELRNCGVINVNVSGKGIQFINYYESNVGGMIGNTENCQIYNCSVTGNSEVRGKAAVGGLIGLDSTSTISDCFSTANVICTNENGHFGELVGLEEYTTIINTESELLSAAKISAGYTHTLMVNGDGTVWAAGLNDNGQLGNGTNSNSTVPVQVKNSNGTGALTGVISVSAGELHSLALKSDGTVWAWGKGVSGRLGINSTYSTSIPAQVRGANGAAALTNVTAISAGYNHSLALKADGTVWSWGYGENGALGNGSTANSNVPVQVKDTGGNGFLTDIIAITASKEGSFAIKSDGTVYAWGKNDRGQLGILWLGNQYLPVRIPGLTNVKAISSFSYHSLALKSDGTVWAWGRGSSGRLGDGHSDGYASSPQQVRGANGSGFLTGITAISAGDTHSVAIKDDGTVWTWGSNTGGQLGRNTGGSSVNIYPAQADSIGLVSSILAGSEYNIALSFDNKIYAWGYNQSGKFGNGSANSISSAPVPAFEILPGAVDLASKFPFPHATGQSGQNNCAPWAAVYALKSGQENMARNWGLGYPSWPKNDHLFSPSYVYNQLNHGSSEGGVRMEDVLNIMVDQGVCSLASFPYTANNYNIQPNAGQRAEAAQYKAIEWHTISGVENIKRHLASGDGVLITFNVLKQFDLLNAMPLPQPGFPKVFDDPTINLGYPRGTHTVCLIGYDDNMGNDTGNKKGAFKFINSWGNNTGFSGYGWISYDMINNSNVNLYTEAGKGLGFVLKSHYAIDAIVSTYNSGGTNHGGMVIGGGLYNAAANVSLSAYPRYGYKFIGWYENGSKISGETTLSFKAATDRKLEARFQKNYIIDATAATLNSALPDAGGTTAGSGLYTPAANVSLSAYPKDGYTFLGWYENGSKISDGRTLSFKAETDRKLEARFQKNHIIDAAAVTRGSALPDAGGTVAGGGLYLEGTTVTLTAVAAAGYNFIGWYENDIRINHESATYRFTAEKARKLEARFMQQTGFAAPFYIMITAGTGGTVTGDGLYYYGDIVRLTAAPNNGYTFDGWYENNVKINGAGVIYSFAVENFRALEARFIH